MTIDKKFDGINLGKSKKKIEWKYSGKVDMYLEGRVWDSEGDKLKISLCGSWTKDAVNSNYVNETKTFEIYVTLPPKGITRIRLLKSVDFYVPKETKKVQVYEARDRVVKHAPNYVLGGLEDMAKDVAKEIKKSEYLNILMSNYILWAKE